MWHKRTTSARKIQQNGTSTGAERVFASRIHGLDEIRRIEDPKWGDGRQGWRPACGRPWSEALIQKHKHLALEWCLCFWISVSLNRAQRG